MRRVAVGSVLWIAGNLLAQVPTCRLEGYVIDPLEQPVRGALVTAEIAGEILARTQTDGDGLFVFGKLPTEALVVQARTGDPDIGAVWIDLLGRSQHFVRIRTMPARRVTGVVQDDQGARVGGAWVVVGPAKCGELGLSTSMVQAKPDGTFTLGHVPMGDNFVRAWAPGYDGFAGEVTGRADTTVTCTVQRDAVFEHVFELDDRGALPNAQLAVRAYFGDLPLPLPPAVRRPERTDGHWVVRGWPVDDALAIELLGTAGRTSPPAFVIPAESGSRTRTFTMPEGGRLVRGKLAGGEALGGLWLVAQPLQGDLAHARSRCQTAADGTFELVAPVVAGAEFQLRVLSDRHCITAATRAGDPEPMRVDNSWLVASCDAAALTIQIAQPHLLSARIVAADGTPARGVEVQLLDPDQPWNSPRMVAFTGTEGELAVALPPEASSAKILLHAQGPMGFLFEAAALSATGHTDLGDLAMPERASLRIACVDANATDQPIAGARVLLDSAYRATQQFRTNRRGQLLVSGLPTYPTSLRSTEDDDFVSVSARPGAPVVTLRVPAPR